MNNPVASGAGVHDHVVRLVGVVDLGHVVLEDAGAVTLAAGATADAGGDVHIVQEEDVYLVAGVTGTFGKGVHHLAGVAVAQPRAQQDHDLLGLLGSGFGGLGACRSGEGDPGGNGGRTHGGGLDELTAVDVLHVLLSLFSL